MIFLDIFPALEIGHLVRIGSDRDPLLLRCDTAEVPVKKSFKFLKFWVNEESFT